MNEKIKQQLIDNIKWSNQREPEKPGGQSCGLIPMGVKLYSEETDIEIYIGYHRSQVKNKNLAMTLFLLAIEDLNI